MPTRTATTGILSEDKAGEREELIELLKKAYWMELETVMSYIANSVNPDGVRAQETVESLQEDVQEELGHAQQFAAHGDRHPPRRGGPPPPVRGLPARVRGRRPGVGTARSE
jgi:ferritin-like protein